MHCIAYNYWTSHTLYNISKASLYNYIPLILGNIADRRIISFLLSCCSITVNGEVTGT